MITTKVGLDFQELSNYLVGIEMRLPKSMQPVIGKELLEVCLKCLKCFHAIEKPNPADVRARVIDTLFSELDMVDELVRLISSTHTISNRQLGIIAFKLQGIRKQLGGLRKSYLRTTGGRD